MRRIRRGTIWARRLTNLVRNEKSDDGKKREGFSSSHERVPEGVGSN
jgi:hypothetical protein